MKYVLLALAALCSLNACSKSTPNGGTESSQSPTIAKPAPVASNTVESVLGFKAELASDRPVRELQADFNGDGVKDRLFVLKSASLPAEAPANVTVVRPFRLDEDERVGGLADGAAVNLAIVDGKASQVTVLHDDNSISMLDAPTAPELEVVLRANIASLEQPELARAASGDLLVVPTPAGINTYIYWDGGTYKLFEPLEMP